MMLYGIDLIQWVVRYYSGKYGDVDSVLYLVLMTWPTATVCAQIISTERGYFHEMQIISTERGYFHEMQTLPR